MKQFVSIISVCILLSFETQAQPPARISPELATLINVPFLIPGSARRSAHESSTILRFDKRIKISNTASGRESETYLYINTRNGSIATRTGRAGKLGDGSFNINDKKFRLSYYTPAGLYYTYYNREKKGELLHYVATMNTEMVAYSTNLVFERTSVNRAGSSKNVLPQNLQATPYKASGSSAAPTIYLYGGPTPQQFLLKRFLGYAGIGYVKTDKGIWMIVEMSSDAGSFKATEWEDIDLQFDKTPFIAVENRMNEKAVTGIDKKIAELDAKTYSGPCAYLYQAKKEWNRQELERQKQALARMNQGNLINDINNSGLGALIDFQDPEYSLKGAEIEADIRICNSENSKITTEDEAQRQSKTIECANKTKTEIQKAKREMMAITRRYPNDKAKALIEKRKVLTAYQKAARELDCDRK
ncbi:hypothetical protein [Niabella aurantiaca]|uniref:hypothetical protein n=1 Tax=Niabella aurantiaca TaxID=379900 RepID=UPI00039ED709|nr:hypothetical protein [Niabella aurantiaca]